MTATAKAELEETLKAAYTAACEEQNEKEAAELARKLRNKLLENSDAQMTLDRLGLDLSSTAKFIASLGAIFSGVWAQYRQALRDLPTQEGFPFNVVFPTPPETEEGGDNEPI